MEREVRQQEIIPTDHIMPADATAFQWAELLMPALLAFISVVIPAYIGYMIVRAKVRQRNAIKRRAWEETHNGEEYDTMGDETKLDFLKDKIDDLTRMK